MNNLTIRPMSTADIPAVVPVEHAVWHAYYRQYPFYDTIADSVTPESLTQDWQAFFADSGDTSLVTGHDRVAFVACDGEKIVGVAAASAYVPGKWPVVDDMLRRPDGSLTRTAKFQNLYVDAAYRGRGIGKQLSLARADAMLAKGYEALFMTAFDGAMKTISFHRKNGLQQVHAYESLQSFKDGQHMRILCFLHKDLKAWREKLA